MNLSMNPSMNPSTEPGIELQTLNPIHPGSLA